jgi:hypothetical protein
LHWTVDADSVSQRKPLDPRLDVGEDLGLHRSLKGKVTDDEVGKADLEVLPLREPSPEAADTTLPLQHQGPETCAARVVQVNQPSKASTDDDQVKQGLFAHRGLV